MNKLPMIDASDLNTETVIFTKSEDCVEPLGWHLPRDVYVLMLNFVGQESMASSPIWPGCFD